ncbi:MAG: hypothetical protein K2P80_16180 [Beijerinckiaceae bacterium]|nr:hypothetical protein [Beijerinckiaceae bacterium]
MRDGGLLFDGSDAARSFEGIGVFSVTCSGGILRSGAMLCVSTEPQAKALLGCGATKKIAAKSATAILRSFSGLIGLNEGMDQFLA